MIEQTPKRQNTDSFNPINRLAEAVADVTFQRRPQRSSPLIRPTKTKYLVIDSTKAKLELFADLFQSKLMMQPEKTEALKRNSFRSDFRNKALQTFKDNIASNKRT